MLGGFDKLQQMPTYNSPKKIAHLQHLWTVPKILFYALKAVRHDGPQKQPMYTL